MIKAVLQNSRYMAVSGVAMTSPYTGPGAVGVGMLRWNSNSNSIEANDGNTWKEIDSSFALIGLTSETESLLDWAREQQHKQQVRHLAAERNPALKKAYKAIQRAEENFDLLEIIAGKHGNTDQVQSGP